MINHVKYTKEKKKLEIPTTIPPSHQPNERKKKHTHNTKKKNNKLKFGYTILYQFEIQIEIRVVHKYIELNSVVVLYIILGWSIETYAMFGWSNFRKDKKNVENRRENGQERCLVGREGGEKIGRVRLFFSLGHLKFISSNWGENESENETLHFEQKCLFLPYCSPITQIRYITFCLFLFAIHPTLFKK